jgi:adenosylcobinamide-phosphate synthase
VTLLVAQRSLHDHVARVMRALDKHGLAAGRAAVSHIVGRDPASLDAHGVARAGIESLAENFSDGVVAPALFYLVAGLPGLIIYKTVNTLDSMIGHKTPRHLAFGWASARFDDLLNLIPARLAGVLVGAAALFLAGRRPRPRHRRGHACGSQGIPDRLLDRGAGAERRSTRAHRVRASR